MRRHGQAEEIVTDRFASYRAALKEFGASDKQQTGRCLNNRVENSHLPLRCFPVFCRISDGLD